MRRARKLRPVVCDSLTAGYLLPPGVLVACEAGDDDCPQLDRARRVHVIAADAQGAAASMGDGANGEARSYGG